MAGAGARPSSSSPPTMESCWGEHRTVVGHTLSLHDDLIHVPLIVKHPGRDAGTRVPEVVQTLDLYRTILGWTGTSLDGLPPAQVELPSLDEPLPDRVAIAEEDYTDSWNVVARLQELNPSLSETAYPFSQRAARSATHKLVEYETGPGELYDLRAGPGERSNLLLTMKRRATGCSPHIANGAAELGSPERDLPAG